MPPELWFDAMRFALVSVPIGGLFVWGLWTELRRAAMLRSRPDALSPLPQDVEELVEAFVKMVARVVALSKEIKLDGLSAQQPRMSTRGEEGASHFLGRRLGRLVLALTEERRLNAPKDADSRAILVLELAWLAYAIRNGSSQAQRRKRREVDGFIEFLVDYGSGVAADWKVLRVRDGDAFNSWIHQVARTRAPCAGLVSPGGAHSEDGHGLVVSQVFGLYLAYRSPASGRPKELRAPVELKVIQGGS